MTHNLSSLIIKLYQKAANLRTLSNPWVDQRSPTEHSSKLLARYILTSLLTGSNHFTSRVNKALSQTHVETKARMKLPRWQSPMGHLAKNKDMAVQGSKVWCTQFLITKQSSISHRQLHRKTTQINHKTRVREDSLWIQLFPVENL